MAFACGTVRTKWRVDFAESSASVLFGSQTSSKLARDAELSSNLTEAGTLLLTQGEDRYSHSMAMLLKAVEGFGQVRPQLRTLNTSKGVNDIHTLVNERGRPGGRFLEVQKLSTQCVDCVVEHSKSVIELFLGQRTSRDTVAAATKPNELCEGQFYLGQWHLLRDERADSIEALRKAVESCPKNFIEFAGAVAELKRLEH